MLDAKLSRSEEVAYNMMVERRLPPFLAAYLEHRVRGEPKDGNPFLVCIRRVAERLTHEEDTNRYIMHLCTLIATSIYIEDHLLAMFRFRIAREPISGQEFEDNVHAAAVYMGHLFHVERCGARHARSLIFGSSFELAVQYGSEEMVELHLRGSYVSNRCNAFEYAARHGRADLIRFIFNYRTETTPWKFDENLQIKYEQKVLDRALKTSNPEVWDYLMEIHREYKLPISKFAALENFKKACSLGWTDMAHHLLSRCETFGPDDYQEMLVSRAVEGGHVDIVKLLLDSSIKVPRDAVRNAAAEGHIAIVQLLLTYGYDLTGALVAAARGGFFDIVKLLMENGADSNEGHRQADSNCHCHIIGECFFSSVGLCESDKGDDSRDVKYPSFMPLSAVSYAILAEDERMFHYLLSHGASLPEGRVRDGCVARAKERGIESMLALLDP
jgi:ankyrin repeat protein